MRRALWSRSGCYDRRFAISRASCRSRNTHFSPASSCPPTRGGYAPWTPIATTSTSFYYYKDLPRRRWLSSNHVSDSGSSFHNHHHGATTEPDYQKYRTFDRSPYMIADMQLETLRTRQRLNPQLLQECQDLVQDAWNKQNRPPPPEYGPTGMWLYSFHDDMHSSRRIYQRSSCTKSNSSHNPPTTSATAAATTSLTATQMVLELEPTDEVLSLSLSVDESCIACLVENVATGIRQVRLRHIELDRQTTWDLLGDGTLYHSLVGLEWGPVLEGDLHSLYFVGTDHQGRPDRILASTVHATLLHVQEPHLLLQSTNPAEMVDVQRTKGCQYVAIHVMTKTSNEIYLSDGSLPLSSSSTTTEPTTSAGLDLVLPRQEQVLYSLDVGERGDIVMLLSDHGRDYRLFETTVGSLPLDPEIIVTSNNNHGNTNPDKVITDMDLFRDYLILYETLTETGYRQITIQDRSSHHASHAVTIPLSHGKNGPCLQATPAGNICYSATSLRLVLETPVAPPDTFELDFPTSTVKPLHQESTEIGSLYQQERVFVPSADGTRVPLSLFYLRDTEEETSSFSIWNWLARTSQSRSDSRKEKSTRPVVVLGYGAYGESVSLGYDPVLVSLLHKGYVLAFAHTRGGGELGKSWHHAGREARKVKSIEDFEACAFYLKNRWKGKLIMKGFSAAGVIMGATVNRQPTLFDTMVLTNPFLDLYSTMKNPDLPLTIHEWDEFGNPIEDRHMDQLLQSYCPITNVAPETNHYPRCLLIGVLDDQNVPFWNATIFAKKIRDRRINKDMVSLHIEEAGGHHLGQNRLQVAALELAFILQDDES